MIKCDCDDFLVFSVCGVCDSGGDGEAAGECWWRGWHVLGVCCGACCCWNRKCWSLPLSNQDSLHLQATPPPLLLPTSPLSPPPSHLPRRPLPLLSALHRPRRFLPPRLGHSEKMLDLFPTLNCYITGCFPVLFYACQTKRVEIEYLKWIRVSGWSNKESGEG